MSFGWQQQQPTQQQETQPDFHLHSQRPTFSEPFVPVQQQGNQHPLNNMNTATGAMPNIMPGMPHSASFSGIQNASLSDNPDQSTNADLNNILSNYNPKMPPNHFQPQIPFSQHQNRQIQQHVNSASAAAAVAVAAYGQFGMQQNPMSNFNTDPSTSMSMNQQIPQNAPMQGHTGQIPGFMSGTTWTAMQNQQNYPTPAHLHVQMMNNSKGAAATTGTGGYEGDASNTSSTQTPGASSGEDVNGNGKRRSNTVSHAPNRPSVSAFANAAYGGGSTTSSDAYTNNTASINLNTGDTLKAPPQRPALRHRRSHSGSQAISSNSVSWASEKRLSGPDLSYNINTSPVAPYAPSLLGHAASHPPGLGGQILRGVDIGSSGSSAATDFTKRKGWHNRIVDELLDFVHVLDENGKVVHAASSVGTLTGWKLDELRGRMITDFIHKDDAKAFMDEFQSCWRERREMTIYYRFRKKPQTAEDKKRVRDQRIASNVGLSNSGSTSEGDSSSNQDSIKKSVTTFAGETIGKRAENVEDDEESEFHDDREAKYVVFEVTGHPYFSDEQDLIDLGKGVDGAEPTSPLMNSKINSTQRSPIRKKGMVTESANLVKKEDDDQNDNRTQCFFLTGRVYPTKNVGMLDSFLELKLENERLRVLLGELSVNDGSMPLPVEGSSEGRRSLDEGAYPIDYPVDLESNKTGSTGRGVGHMGNGSLEDITETRRASLTSPRNIPSAPTSPQQMRMERSLTSNTIDASTAAGEESDEAESPLLDGTDDPKRKKKKAKQEEGDFVCTDCGRVDSPEWRKGPLGPKTLCNACGLRWAKKIKRSGGDPNAVSKAGAAAKAQEAAKVLGQNSMSSLPATMGKTQSFAGAGAQMERPSMTSSQSSNAAMFGSMHQPQHPPMPHSANSFDTSLSSMQAALYSASPTQIAFGPQSGPIPAQMDHPGAMPPLMHQNSSYMSQSSSGPHMNNQMSQQQQQQQQQQMQYGQVPAGFPPNHMMY